MGKKKCASGGMIHSPKSMQEQLADIRPRFADGGKVDPVEELLKRSAAKYGTAVLPPAPQPPVAPPATTAQQMERGLLSLPGKIQQRTDELQRVMNYDKPRGMAAGGIPGIDEPVSLAGPAPFRQDIGAGSGATALQSGNVTGFPSAAGTTPQSQGFLGAADYSTGPKQGGLVWSDGTPRGDSTSHTTIEKRPAPTPYVEPVLTFAENQIAAGINPNAAYRPGGPGDPHASGGLAATVQQRAALPDATQAQPMPAMPANPMDSPSRRSRGRQQFANGGMVRFSGKGGPREDQIPVKVAGESIRVSDGESAVIIPAKTAANPQAVQAIGQVIQQSNDGRAPDMGIKDGELTPAQLAAQLYQEQTRQQAPVGANPLPASRGVTGSFQSGASGDIPQVERAGQVGATVNAKTDPAKYPYTGQAAQNPYQEASLTGAVSAITPPAQSEVVRAPVAANQQPAGMASSAAPVATKQGVFASLPEGGMLTTPQGRQKVAQFFSGEGLRPDVGILGPKTPAGSAQTVPTSNPATFSNAGRPSAAQSAGMAAQAIAAKPDQRIAANTGNAGNAKFNPDTVTLTFTNPGFDVTEQQVAPGTGMVSRANGQIQAIANMSPNQYTAADGTKNARWEQTQQYIDAQARLQADKARVAEVEATQQGMNPVQAIAATQGMAQAAQRAPLERGVLQQQIETGKVAAQNAKELQDLYALHKASVDPAEQERIAEQIRIRTGTYKPEEFAHAAGGTTINPATMGVEKTPDVIYSKRTGKPAGADRASASMIAPPGHSFIGTSGGIPVFRNDKTGALVQNGK